MNLKSVSVNFLRLAGAAVGLGLLLVLSGMLVRPDLSAKPPSYSKDEIDAAEKARRTELNSENLPRL
ncbi:MAG: hypothetical protein SVV80_07615, partial [Planctomycetota bacterium]|nr:hypothetical protein [Planctomycetota bacterium]